MVRARRPAFPAFVRIPSFRPLYESLARSGWSSMRSGKIDTTGASMGGQTGP